MLTANPDAAVKQYQSIATQSRVADASPHRLIQLMMERALTKIDLAKTQMQEGRIADKGSAP